MCTIFQLGKYVRVKSRDLLNLATHNYLGMVGDGRVEAASLTALRKYGVGACGPRTFFGTVGTSLSTAGSSGPFFGGKLWRRGPNLPPFSIFSTDLGHFILKLLYVDIILFYVYFLYLFSRLGRQIACGGFMALGRAMALNAPWIRRCLCPLW